MEILLKSGQEAQCVSQLHTSDQVYGIRITDQQKHRLDELIAGALKHHNIPVIHGQSVAYFGLHARTIVHHLMQKA